MQSRSGSASSRGSWTPSRHTAQRRVAVLAEMRHRKMITSAIVGLAALALAGCGVFAPEDSDNATDARAEPAPDTEAEEHTTGLEHYSEGSAYEAGEAVPHELLDDETRERLSGNEPRRDGTEQVTVPPKDPASTVPPSEEDDSATPRWEHYDEFHAVWSRGVSRSHHEDIWDRLTEKGYAPDGAGLVETPGAVDRVDAPNGELWPVGAYFDVDTLVAGSSPAQPENRPRVSVDCADRWYAVTFVALRGGTSPDLYGPTTRKALPAGWGRVAPPKMRQLGKSTTSVRQPAPQRVPWSPTPTAGPQTGRQSTPQALAANASASPTPCFYMK